MSIKKNEKLVVLSLAILTSLTAETLAVYTKTVIETERVEANRFTFSATGDIAGDSVIINPASTEITEYKFFIAYVDNTGGMVADVPTQYDVTINFPDAYNEMDGLMATLKDSTGNTLALDNGGIIFYTKDSTTGILFDTAYAAC